MEINVERARTRCGTAPFLDENAHRECFSWERPVGVVVLSLRSFRIRWTIELGRPRGREKSAVTRHGLALYAVSLSTRAWLIRIVLFFFREIRMNVYKVLCREDEIDRFVGSSFWR